MAFLRILLGVYSGFVRPKSGTIIRGSSFNTKNAELDTKTWSSHKAQLHLIS